ncbi:enoyl-CoA hydratase [Bacillus sp. CGMCC 1.16607]|uniref:enoyl-CoA hydratase n=1 Tax=Bacillus sp. CGMCC 1.16607 TaxID=3351842 RepID=UPI00362D4174
MKIQILGGVWLVKDTTELVLLKVNNRVATVEMNRPEAMNALNGELIKGLIVKLKEISKLADIDIIILTGNEKAFSAGGDIKSMLELSNDQDFYSIMDDINELLITLYSLPKLTVSAISGAAAGLGLSLALATDYVIADVESKLAMNFIGIGLIPDGGSHFFLEKRLGEVKAKKLIWEGKVMSASSALQIGLIDEVTEGELSDSVNLKVSQWLHSPIRAMLQTKKIFAENNIAKLLQILELEKLGQHKMRQTKDHLEGIQAFVEKRKPNFIGK